MQDELKKVVGWVVFQYVQFGIIVGVGIGLMVVYFIDVLGIMKGQIEGVVFSLDVLIEKFKGFGIYVFDFNEVDSLGIYVDGVDEINGYMQMIKGGGVVLICEKIIVFVVEKFICIVDVFKQVDIFGKFLLLVEVILMVCSVVVC